MSTVDYGILAPAWAATGAADLVDDNALLTAMLDTEVALAEAQAELGVIPAGAAVAIRAAAVPAHIDLAVVAAGVRETANPVVAFVEQFTAAVRSVDASAAEYVHRGSTSQDILDTALTLLCAATLDRIANDLLACADSLAGHAERHRDTPMAGRTLTQHAVPVTFGLKAATWLHLVLDAVQRVRRTRAALPVSLGGAAGTLAAYHQYALDTTDPAGATLRLPALVASRLGLAEPVLPWHGVRTPLADVAASLMVTTGALGKLAADVLVLSRTEIGEVTEEQAPGRGASSAMPQKHNPVFSTLVATAARQLPPIALVLFGSMAVEDERSSGGWHAEWQPLRECLRIGAGAAANAARLAADASGLARGDGREPAADPRRHRLRARQRGAGAVARQGQRQTPTGRGDRGGRAGRCRCRRPACHRPGGGRSGRPRRARTVRSVRLHRDVRSAGRPGAPAFRIGPEGEFA